MLGHFKKSASILTDQETQMVDNDRRPATICNTAYFLRELFSRKYSWVIYIFICDVLRDLVPFVQF